MAQPGRVQSAIGPALGMRGEGRGRNRAPPFLAIPAKILWRGFPRVSRCSCPLFGHLFGSLLNIRANIGESFCGIGLLTPV